MAEQSSKIGTVLTDAHDGIIRAAAAAPIEAGCNPLLTMLNAMLREAQAQAFNEGVVAQRDATRASGGTVGRIVATNPYHHTSPDMPSADESAGEETDRG